MPATKKKAVKRKPVSENNDSGELVVEVVDIDSVSIDPSNVRDHSERNIESIKSSLSMFRQQKPIVVNRDSQIVTGNGTWDAAKQLGWTKISIVRTDLNQEQSMAFAIADNKSSDLSTFDFDGLSKQLRELSEGYPDLLEATGFADFEIEPILAGEWNPPVVDEKKEEPKPAEAEDSDGQDGRHVVGFADDQWVVIYDAIKKLRVAENMDDPEMISSSRAIELICADYLSSP